MLFLIKHLQRSVCARVKCADCEICAEKEQFVIWPSK